MQYMITLHPRLPLASTSSPENRQANAAANTLLRVLAMPAVKLLRDLLLRNALPCLFNAGIDCQ